LAIRRHRGGLGSIRFKPGPGSQLFGAQEQDQAQQGCMLFLFGQGARLARSLWSPCVARGGFAPFSAAGSLHQRQLSACPIPVQGLVLHGQHDYPGPHKDRSARRMCPLSGALGYAAANVGHGLQLRGNPRRSATADRGCIGPVTSGVKVALHFLGRQTRVRILVLSQPGPIFSRLQRYLADPLSA
jgi:hypothetical protein